MWAALQRFADTSGGGGGGEASDEVGSESGDRVSLRSQCRIPEILTTT
jgi:hypothetical protein